jgi:hypothetical protein
MGGDFSANPVIRRRAAKIPQQPDVFDRFETVTLQMDSAGLSFGYLYSAVRQNGTGGFKACRQHNLCCDVPVLRRGSENSA